MPRNLPGGSEENHGTSVTGASSYFDEFKTGALREKLVTWEPPRVLFKTEENQEKVCRDGELVMLSLFPELCLSGHVPNGKR